MVLKERPTTVIRSLSGLVNYQGLVIGVSDEFYGLFVRDYEKDQFFSFETDEFKKLTYLQRKKTKLDHESISIFKFSGDDYLIAVPSLSKTNRIQAGIVKCIPPITSSNGLFEKTFTLEGLLSTLSAGNREINIEGHFFCKNRFGKDSLFLLNRGNQSAPNELIQIQNGSSWLETAVRDASDNNFKYSIERQQVDLGTFEGNRIQWTDGLFENGSQFLFLATIEKTSNAIDDGDVLCSFLGRYDFITRRVLAIRKILDFKKAEGLCIWNSRFLVCIDSDSEEMSNEFYSFPLNLID